MDEQAVSERFSKNLAQARDAAGLTIEALANKSEIHRSQISEYLGGRAQPKIGALARLAGALDVAPAKLLEGISFEPAERQGNYKISPSKKS